MTRKQLETFVTEIGFEIFEDEEWMLMDNEWGGFDAAHASGAMIRLALDDNQVRVFSFDENEVGEGELRVSGSMIELLPSFVDAAARSLSWVAA
jgi:hypothetical protein